MTNFARTVPQTYNGKHNMASDAFQALRNAQAKGEATNGGSFADLVDTINPLQHIPVVSSIYRELTGDQISNQARIAGGALYGGAIGFVASMANSAIDIATGEDIGGHVMASLFGSDAASPDTQPVKLASANDPTAENAALITGSIAPKASTGSAAAATPQKPEAAPTSATRPAPALPQLSPEAFNALIGSFDDPEAAKKANAALAGKIVAQASGASDTPAPVAASTSASTPANISGIASKMEAGLGQLDALKAAQAKSLSLGATTNGLAGASACAF